MAEAWEGSDMTQFTAWAVASAMCTLLAAWAAWAITSAPEQYRGRHRAGDPFPGPGKLSAMEPGSYELPRHVIERVKPLDAEEQVPVRPCAPKVVEEPREDPRITLPRPGTVRVVPLWVGLILEDQRQAERRRALEAAADGRPDTGYTYPGAHLLAGAVA